MNRLMIIAAWIKTLLTPYKRVIVTRRTPQLDMTWIRYPQTEAADLKKQLMIRKRYGDGSTACVFLTEAETDYVFRALEPPIESWMPRAR
jgi:hypothetical protein